MRHVYLSLFLIACGSGEIAPIQQNDLEVIGSTNPIEQHVPLQDQDAQILFALNEINTGRSSLLHIAMVNLNGTSLTLETAFGHAGPRTVGMNHQSIFLQAAQELGCANRPCIIATTTVLNNENPSTSISMHVQNEAPCIFWIYTEGRIIRRTSCS